MILSSIIVSWAVALLGLQESSEHWPQFRGPRSSGVSEGPPPPWRWGDDAGEEADGAVRWRTDLPGLAHASPVVWGDSIFVVCAERDGDAELKIGLYGAGDSVNDEGEHAFTVMCLDKESGDILWEEVAFEGVPAVKRHPKASHASSTPAVDEERVVAFFATEGLYCYDHEGTLLWSRDFGVLDCGAPGMRHYQWGFAASPVLYDGKVIVQCDVQDDSFLAVLDGDTGETLWRTEREEPPTWGTPNIHVQDGKAQVLCNGYEQIGGYDFATGELLWTASHGGDVPVPTLVVAHDLIYLTSAHGRNAPIGAIEVGAKGTIELSADDPQMRWYYGRRGNYMQTPLIYGDEAYFCSDSGILACYDAQTGDEHYRERLGSGNSGFSASGIASNGRLYFTSEEGEIHVLAAGPTFEPLAVNTMGDVCMATPALSDGVLFVRTRSQLVAIGSE